MRLYDIQKTTLVFRVYAWVHFIKHIGTNYKPTTSLFKSIGSQECVCVCAHTVLEAVQASCVLGKCSTTELHPMPRTWRCVLASTCTTLQDLVEEKDTKCCSTVIPVSGGEGPHSKLFPWQAKDSVWVKKIHSDCQSKKLPKISEKYQKPYTV